MLQHPIDDVMVVLYVHIVNVATLDKPCSIVQRE